MVWGNWSAIAGGKYICNVHGSGTRNFSIVPYLLCIDQRRLCLPVFSAQLIKRRANRNFNNVAVRGRDEYVQESNSYSK